MITIDDMKKAVVAALNENFGYPCYEFGVVEQMEYPCFFVRIAENGELYTKNRYQQRYAVEIVLMHERGEHGQEIKVLKDIEKIKQIFLFAMQTEKKKVPIMNFEMEYTGERGNVPRITFDSEFLDNLYKPSDAPLMKELEMKEDLNDGNAKH